MIGRTWAKSWHFRALYTIYYLQTHLEYGVLYEAEDDEKYRDVKQVEGVVSEDDIETHELGPNVL